MGHRPIARTAAALAVTAAAAVWVTTTVVGASTASNAPDGARIVRAAGTDSPTESNFVSVKPCRLVDTRATGQVQPGQIKSYKTQGDTTSQGGSADCGVPPTAGAVELNVTAISATSTGFLRLYPAGGAEPTATFMNYTPTFNVSNDASVALTAGKNANLKMKNYGGRVQVVIDVLGYYVPNLMAVVQSNGTLTRGNGVLTVAREAPGQYRVNFERNITGCAFSGGLNDDQDGLGSKGYLAMARSGSGAGGVFVETYNSSGTKTDTDFHVVVTC